jgi:hypothetical protein
LSETPESSRTIVRQWLRDQLDGQDDVQVPELTAKAIAHFKGDIDFMTLLVEETLPGTVGDLAYHILSRARGSAIRMGDSIVTRDGFDQRVERSRFRDWMEHAGDRHIALLALTKQTGQLAIAERRGRGDEEYRRAAFLERLIKPLRGKQVIGDRWTDEAIDQIRQEIWPKPAPKTEEAEASAA